MKHFMVHTLEHIHKKDGDSAKLKQVQQIMHEGLCYVAGGY